MRIPRVNPVGVVEYPEEQALASDGTFADDESLADDEPLAGDSVEPRRFSGLQRTLASALLTFFFLATVASSILSVGAYCLTSDGGDTRALQESIQQLKGE
ncbi:MAG: hypothetical protein AAF560_24845 [Acidobacteriota bacterium]